MASYTEGFRNLNQEFLGGLELVTTKIFPLPGATGRRQSNTVDSRLVNLNGLTPAGDEVSYYEHFATVIHKPTETRYVAFRETMDAFLARHTVCSCTAPKFNAEMLCGQCGKWSAGKHPEWLMKSPQKQRERQIHIYEVTRHPKTVPILRSLEDWLRHLDNPVTFDTLVAFLFREKVIDEQMLAGLR